MWTIRSRGRINGIFSVTDWIILTMTEKSEGHPSFWWIGTLSALYHNLKWFRPLSSLCQVHINFLVLSVILCAWPHCPAGFSHRVGRLYGYIPLQNVIAAECLSAWSMSLFIFSLHDWGVVLSEHTRMTLCHFFSPSEEINYTVCIIQ